MIIVLPEKGVRSTSVQDFWAFFHQVMKFTVVNNMNMGCTEKN